MIVFEWSATYLIANSFWTKAVIKAVDATLAERMDMYKARRELTINSGRPIFTPITDPSNDYAFTPRPISRAIVPSSAIKILSRLQTGYLDCGSENFFLREYLNLNRPVLNIWKDCVG